MQKQQLDAFKDFIWKELVKMAITGFFKKYLGAVVGGALGWFLSSLLGAFAEELYRVMNAHVALQKIEMKNRDMRIAYERAAVKLQIIYDQLGPDSKEFENARKEELAALQKFIRIGTA